MRPELLTILDFRGKLGFLSFVCFRPCFLVNCLAALISQLRLRQQVLQPTHPFIYTCLCWTLFCFQCNGVEYWILVQPWIHFICLGSVLLSDWNTVSQTSVHDAHVPLGLCLVWLVLSKHWASPGSYFNQPQYIPRLMRGPRRNDEKKDDPFACNNNDNNVPEIYLFLLPSLLCQTANRHIEKGLSVRGWANIEEAA